MNALLSRCAAHRIRSRVGCRIAEQELQTGEELSRLHYDVAISANRSAFAALTALVASSQILFGSDYPSADVGATVRGASTMGMSAQDLQRIHRDNAVALFPRLKAIA